MAVMDQLAHAGGHETDAVLVVLDLLRNADKHLQSPIDGIVVGLPSHHPPKTGEGFSFSLPINGGFFFLVSYPGPVFGAD
jgi:hypothetical protein